MIALSLQIRLRNVAAYIRDFHVKKGNPPQLPCVGIYLASADALTLLVVATPLTQAAEESGFLDSNDVKPRHFAILEKQHPALVAEMLHGWISFEDEGKGKDFKFIIRVPKSLTEDDSFKDELLKQFHIPKELAVFRGI
jgi:hypothetical protein